MSENSLKFYLITDLHHWAKAQGSSGKGYEKIYHAEHRCMAETGAIINEAIDRIIADKEIDIVLVAGDIVADGAREAHDEVIPMLRRFKDAGKRVFAITATHDYHDKPLKAEGDEVGLATPIKRKELYDMYYEFGRNEAISENKKSHSYSVMLNEKTRLLCMNDDGKGGGSDFCGYFEDCVEWIKSQLDEARANGEYVMVMTHHPALPPSPIYPIFSKRDMLGNYEEITTMLADNGVNFIFTGHTHMTNVAVKTTEKGNKIYDINTGSLVAYPCPYRKLELTDTELKIETLTVDNFNWDFGGKTAPEYVKDHFNGFLEDLFDAVAGDIDRVAELGLAFSMDRETVYENKKLILFFGKRLNTWTLGSLGRRLGVGGKIDKSVKDIVLRDFFIEIVDNVFYGDEPYTPDTPMYKSVAAILDRISALMKPIPKLKGAREILAVVKDGVLYDAPPADWNVVLPR
ncbi:MAG: metallophosphoesterase [Clostridiales bacterium]|nr:metallophosphoesterase [Clostridiales bacterium]